MAQEHIDRNALHGMVCAIQYGRLDVESTGQGLFILFIFFGHTALLVGS